MIEVRSMPMPEVVLQLLLRVARKLNLVVDGQERLSFEALTLAVAAWEKQLPTVGKFNDERQAKIRYLKAKNVERRALTQALSDILATCARVPDTQITPQMLARRALESGVWFDLPPSEKGWFNELVEAWRSQVLELCGGQQPAIDQAVRLRDALDKPMPLV